MTLILSGTSGLSDVDGSAATPAIRGTDANTGIFFPAADTIAFAEGGAEVARFDSSGNFGVGTSTFNSVRTVIQGSQTGGAPQTSGTAQTYGLLRLQGTTFTSVLDFGTNGGDYNWIQATDNSNLATNYSLVLQPNGGNLLVGKTSSLAGGRVTIKSATTQHLGEWQVGTDGYGNLMYNAAGTNVGAINIASASTSYVTTSDYRLKEDVAPMTGALAKIAQLKPVTYKWKADGSDSQGFIAHELQEIVSECVVGEKDAVETYTDEDGNEQTRIKPQGIDTSFLVATLTAAIQEQQALITDLTARITALETNS
jgi:hypothetical protein